MVKSNQLVTTYLGLRRQIARLVMSIVPPKEVEDIVQETYVRLCKIDSGESIDKPRSYVMRTARNLALDHVKRAESRLSLSLDGIDDAGVDAIMPPQNIDPTYAQAVSNEEFVLFCEAVRSLPKQCRRAFVLKKVYGYSIKEIMAEMGLGQPTIETHIVSGTKKCALYLRERQNKHSNNRQVDQAGGGQ